MVSIFIIKLFVCELSHIPFYDLESTNNTFSNSVSWGCHLLSYIVTWSFLFNYWFYYWSPFQIWKICPFLVQIAVKRLKVWSNSEQEEFAAKVETLGRVKHKNLLSFRGYCAEGQEHLILYDYMPNMSLHSHLHGYSSDECLLNWGRRMSIAIGTAEGITYVHKIK